MGLRQEAGCHYGLWTRAEPFLDRAGSVEPVSPDELDVSAKVMYMTNCLYPLEVRKSSTRF